MRSRRKKVNEFALARMYQDRNLKVKDICSSLEITPANLYDRLSAMGIPTRQDSSRKGNRLTATTIRKIYAMHVSGNTKYAIAKKLSIAVATVTYHLNKGIPADLYTPPVKDQLIQATIVMRPPSLWSRIKGWFN